MKLLWNSLTAFARKWFAPCNRLVVRNIQPELPWVDRDHLFFHACFTILVDFVEQEMDGLAGLERYTASLVRMADQQQTDRETAFLREQIADHQTMLRLYRWYVQTDWNEPVAHSPTYARLLQQMNVRSVPLPNGNYQMKFEGVDQDLLARERAMHVVREQDFERVKIKNLMDLTKIHHRLWN